MKVDFINTDNFNIAFALEKALAAGKYYQERSLICFFGPENDYITALSDLGWLRILAQTGGENQTLLECAQIAEEFISFQFIQDTLTIPDGVKRLFLISPTRVFATAALYMRLIIQLQSGAVERCIFIDSLKHFAFKETPSPLLYFPAASIVYCIEHPLSRQWELQQQTTKNILESVTILTNQNDRFKFEKLYLLSCEK